MRFTRKLTTKPTTMKRYQCIKYTRYQLFEFKPGSIYDFTVQPGGNFYGYKTSLGRIIWLTSERMRAHFQELLDLNVDGPGPADDPYDQERVAEEPPQGCIRGAVIATILTIVVVVLYQIFT